MSALSHHEGNVSSLDLVGLSRLMARTSGRPEIAIGLIDSPIALNHPDLPTANIHRISGDVPTGNKTACAHGTFIAGVLVARRGSLAPAICPECRLLVRPIFAKELPPGEVVPGATVETLAGAIVEVVDAGARIINLSLAIQGQSSRGSALDQALTHALRRGVVVIAAAGNERALGGSTLTCCPWIIPVVAYNSRGRPMEISNLGATIGRYGLGAPGEAISSLGTTGDPMTMEGTSVATPFVAGAVALLWSEFPDASAAEVRYAVTQSARRRTAIVPPLLNAWAGYEAMSRVRS